MDSKHTYFFFALRKLLYQFSFSTALEHFAGVTILYWCIIPVITWFICETQCSKQQRSLKKLFLTYQKPKGQGHKVIYLDFISKGIISRESMQVNY